MSKHDEAKQSFLDEGLLILSLAQEAPALFEQATREEKRELLNHHLSNSSWAGGKLTIEWRKPYVYLAEFQDPGSDDPPFGGESEGGPSEMVGETGFEPATLCSRSRCATRLRYSPNACRVTFRPASRQAAPPARAGPTRGRGRTVNRETSSGDRGNPRFPP